MFRSALLPTLLCVLIAVPAGFAGEPTAAPRPMTLHDLASWKRASGITLSPEGGWVAWRLNPAEGDGEVLVKATKADKSYTFATGSGIGEVAFSDDGQWLAFAAFPTKKEADALKKQKKPAPGKVMIVDLSTGKATTVDKVRRFKFAGERGGWIAMAKSEEPPAPPMPPMPGTPSPAAPKGKGGDLVLRELATGLELNIGNVADFAFDKKGRYLAWAIEAEGQSGNGVVLRDMRTGTVRVLDSGEASFERLAWTEQGDGLAFLRGAEDKGFKDKRYAVVGFTGFGGDLQKTCFDPKEDTTFPAGMSLSPDRTPMWDRSLTMLSFGIRTIEKKEESGADKKDTPKAEAPKGDAPSEPKLDPKKPGGEVEPDERPDLVLWHHQDPRLPIQQQVEKDRDKKAFHLAVYHVADKRFVRLADDSLKEVTLQPEALFGVGVDKTPYERMGNLDGRKYQDIYAVDPKTGSRRKVLTQVRHTMGVSEDGRTYLYHRDGHFHAVDLASGKDVNLTKQLPTTFIDDKDDHNVPTPPSRSWGWSADHTSVLLSDSWDVWKVALDGSGGENLTRIGKKEGIRFTRRIVTDPDEKGIDLSQPVVLATSGEWTKKNGISVWEPGKGLRRLVYEDAAFSTVLKAKKADTWITTRETATLAPEIRVSGGDFQQPRQLSDHGAQLKALLTCSGARLVDYKGVDGKKLQASLFLPAGYQPGKRYPTVVYFYERMSDNLNRFPAPGISGTGFNAAWYLSHGYAVLNPDITYRLNDPGMSAVACLVPAVKAAVALGVVDEHRVALHGHSWGGYQTAFTITQTNLFKVAIAGAALTDLVSMSTLVYKNTGAGNQPIFESQQGRFKGPVTAEWEAHVRNSPIFHAANVQTPLLILQNDRDGAVDYTQGVEYFNALKRLNKDVIMLEYTGENHSLAKMANRKDYMVRMKAYLDHHLLGKPAPEWVKQGMPVLKMDAHLKAEVQALKEEVPKPEKPAKP